MSIWGFFFFILGLLTIGLFPMIDLESLKVALHGHQFGFGMCLTVLGVLMIVWGTLRDSL